MRAAFAVVLAIVLATGLAGALAARPLTLGEAQDLARENSLELERLNLQVRSARARARIAGALPPARFFAALRKEFEDFDTFKFPPFLGLSQPLDLFGNRRAARAVAEHDIALAELAIEGFGQRLSYQVAQRYRDLQYRQDLLLAARFSRDLAARSHDIATRRARAGAAPAVDEVRAETAHFHAQAAERQAALEALRAARELGEAMGERAWQAVSVRDRLPGLRLVDTSRLAALAAENRVDLRAHSEVAARFAAEARSQRQRRKPVVSGEVAVKQEDQGTFEYGGLRVDFTPLWHGRIDAQVEVRDLERQAALLERDELARRIDIRTIGLLREIGVLREQLDLFEEQELPSTARQLAMVEQGYRRGGLDGLAVLTSQQRAADSVREYLGVLHEFHHTLLALQRECGMAPLETRPAPTSSEVRGWLAAED